MDEKNVSTGAELEKHEFRITKKVHIKINGAVVLKIPLTPALSQRERESVRKI